MIFPKYIVLALLLISLTLLNSLNLEFVNGDVLEVKILKADAEKVYVQHAKTLLIIDCDLILTKIVDKKGKVKFNSFHQIVHLENEADLVKINDLPEPPNPKEKFVMENRNFIYLNLSALILGMEAGVCYERFITNYISVTLGYNKGEIFFPSIKYSEELITDIPFEVKYVPHSNLNISGELGVGASFWKWERHRHNSYNGDEGKIEYEENFLPTYTFGIRYQPDKTGVTFKAGVRTIANDRHHFPSLYINLGMRF